MNNTFNLSRFGKYFAYDIKSRWSENRTFTLICVLIPLIYYFVYIFFSAMGNGFNSSFSDFHINSPHLPIRWAVFAISAVIFMILFPSRAYGFITEKAKGSAWIELPASRLEKFCSMMLITLIIIPVLFFFGYLLIDGLICLFDKACGESLFSSWAGFAKLDKVIVDDGDINLSGFGYWGIASAVLQASSIFLLGALIFKKNKVTKTILCLFVVFMVIFALSAVIFSNIDLDAFGDKVSSWMMNHVDSLDFWINFWGNVELAIIVIGCGIWSWFRVKKVQH